MFLPAPPQEGDSIEEIVASTDWQPHSARGSSPARSEALGIDLVSEKGAYGVRRYYVAGVKS